MAGPVMDASGGLMYRWRGWRTRRTLRPHPHPALAADVDAWLGDLGGRGAASLHLVA